MEIIAQTELVSINATLISQLLSFLIFLYLINRWMFLPLRRTMEERDSRIKQLKQEIETQETEMSALAAEMQKHERTQKAEAFSESETLEAAGKDEAQRILHAAQNDIKSQQNKAAAESRTRIEALRRELHKETEPLVSAIIESLLGRRLNP
jgi:F-type H+-transporting ATPase subunit b